MRLILSKECRVYTTPEIIYYIYHISIHYMNAAVSSILFLLSVSLREETFISIFLSSSLFFLFSPSSHFGETSFGTYIRNVPRRQLLSML